LNLKSSRFPRLSLGGVVMGVLLGGLMALALERGTFHLNHLSQKDAMATVKRLQVLTYSGDAAKARKLCTAFGWPILEKMTASGHEFLSNYSIGQVKVTPELTDVQMVEDTGEGKSVLWVRLRPVEGSYKFNNMYIEKFRGLPVRLRLSEIYNHLEATGNGFGQNCDTNADAGIQRFNEVTTGIGNVLDIIIKLRELSVKKN